jgi:hypothetical protein
MPVKRPVAEVLVMPDLRDSAGGLVWPEMCCCCGGAVGLDKIAIYGRTRFGGANMTFHIPYCRRCTSHHGRAGQRAGESFGFVFIIGFSSLSVAFILGVLADPFLAFFLQLLVFFGSAVWAVRAYFVARAEIRNGITPACTGSETPAVFFAGKQGDGWRFRFFNPVYAEQFAAANVSAPLTTLLTDF